MIIKNNNFHIFVILVSIIYYFLLRKYYKDFKQSNVFFLILYIFVIFYLFAYLSSYTNIFNEKISEIPELFYPSSIDII